MPQKFCADCAYSTILGAAQEYVCLHLECSEQDPNGGVFFHPHCVEARSLTGKCQTPGLLFRGKPESITQ